MSFTNPRTGKAYTHGDLSDALDKIRDGLLPDARSIEEIEDTHALNAATAHELVTGREARP